MKGLYGNTANKVPGAVGKKTGLVSGVQGTSLQSANDQN
jgi:hypothetical protein